MHFCVTFPFLGSWSIMHFVLTFPFLLQVNKSISSKDEDYGFDFGRPSLKYLHLPNDEGPSRFSSASEESFITPRLYHDVDPILLDLEDLFMIASPKDPRFHTYKVSMPISMDEIGDALEHAM